MLPGGNCWLGSARENRKHGTTGLWTDDAVCAQAVLLLKLHHSAMSLRPENAVLDQSRGDRSQVVQQHLYGFDGLAGLAMSYEKHSSFLRSVNLAFDIGAGRVQTVLIPKPLVMNISTGNKPHPKPA